MPFFQMFNALGATVPAANDVLTRHRPSQISEYLEAVWDAARPPALDTALGLGDPPVAANVAEHRAMARPPAALADWPNIAFPLAVPFVWHHVVYAYLLENTRIVEIFRRVVREWTHGERLPVATLATQRWLQVTEQLLFASPWPYSVRATTSSVRPSADGVRRSTYYRLLGMELNHGPESAGASAYQRPDVGNREFASVFEALLAEVWRAYTNIVNFGAQNTTDINAMDELIRRLREMLHARRQGTTLSREEFDAVALMSWLHLTVSHDNDVMVALNATAPGVADRLKNVGDRVGLPAHARSDAYFQLAVPMSAVLRAVEAGGVVPGDLYVPGAIYEADMLQIITHWSIATGRDVKDLSTRPAAGTVLATTGARASPSNGEGGRVVPFSR